jgi:hypothetical protein
LPNPFSPHAIVAKGCKPNTKTSFVWRRYSVIIFGYAGIPEFSGTIAVGVVNVASTFIAMKFIDKLGRKWLLLVGALVQSLCFVIAATIISASHLIKEEVAHPATWPQQCLDGYDYFGRVAFNSSTSPTFVLKNVDIGECCMNTTRNGAVSAYSYYDAGGECQQFAAGVGLELGTLAEGVSSAITTPPSEASKAASYLVVVFICLFVIGFGASWGPTAWVVRISSLSFCCCASLPCPFGS